MHELSVVFHVAKMVENIAKENNVKHVKRVVLQVGEVSLIVHADLSILKSFVEIILILHLKRDVLLNTSLNFNFHPKQQFLLG